MAEYSRIAKGSFVTRSGGGSSPIVLPFVPDRIEFTNYNAMDTKTVGDVVKAYWDVNMGQGYAAYDFYDTGPVYSTAVTSSGGFTTFKAGLSLQYGPKKQVVTATRGSVTTFTVTGHNYVTGDTVVFQGLYQSSTTGMPQICGMPFQITVVNANSFTIEWDSTGSNYTALSGSPAGATVMKVLYPWLYVPGVSFISSISASSSGFNTDIQCTAQHNLVVGQQVAFRIPLSFGTVELDSLPNASIPGSPVYYYVVAVVDAFTFTVNAIFADLSAFIPNQAFSIVGLKFPQVCAVGDVNSGGFPYSGDDLYPSPSYLSGYGTINTINGPAIQGAFVNNTSQGFMIGNVIAPTASQTIYWQAYLDDFVSP